jgi:hypothetical protein
MIKYAFGVNGIKDLLFLKRARQHFFVHNKGAFTRSIFLPDFAVRCDFNLNFGWK